MQHAACSSEYRKFESMIDTLFEDVSQKPLKAFSVPSYVSSPLKLDHIFHYLSLFCHDVFYVLQYFPQFAAGTAVHTTYYILVGE